MSCSTAVSGSGSRACSAARWPKKPFRSRWRRKPILRVVLKGYWLSRDSHKRVSPAFCAQLKRENWRFFAFSRGLQCVVATSRRAEAWCRRSRKYSSWRGRGFLRIRHLSSRNDCGTERYEYAQYFYNFIQEPFCSGFVSLTKDLKDIFGF